MKKPRPPKPCARCGKVTTTYECDWDKATDRILTVCYHCHGDRKLYGRSGAPKKVTKPQMEAFLTYVSTPFEKTLKGITDGDAD